jgi:hypothetical protein
MINQPLLNSNNEAGITSPGRAELVKARRGTGLLDSKEA